MSSLLRQGIDLMNKIVMKVNDLDKFAPIKDVSFLFFDCKNEEELNLILTHPLTKNIILIGDFKSSKENVVHMTLDFWEKNKSSLYEQTKNSFVIKGNMESALDETYSTLSEYSVYYPVVLFFTNQKAKKPEITKSGYSSYIEKDVVCCLNKNLRNFSEYHIKNFEEVSKEKQEKNVNIFRKSGEGIKVPLSIKRSPKKITFQKTEEKLDFNFLSGIKSPSYEKELNKFNMPTSKKWLQEFYEYLKDLLSRIFPEDRKSLISMIINNETLKTHWIPCFTHVSANPNPGKNYEAIETIGDAGLGYSFKFYVKNKEPYSEESRISNLNQQYMSKDFQSKVSKMMKLGEWLITQGVPSDRMDNSEDLLEALFGTIDKLLFMKKGTVGLGSIITYNFMKLLFDKIKFSDEVSKNTEPDRTYVEQFFSGQAFRMIEKQQYTDLRRPKEIPEKLWKNIVDEMNKKLESNNISPVIIKEDKESHRGIIENEKLLQDGRTMVTIKIMKSYADKVRNYGIDLEGKGDLLIGKYTSNTKKTAEKLAYAMAKNWMIEHGLTKEFKNSVNKKKKSATLQRKDMVFEKAKKKFPDLVEGIEISRVKTIKLNGKDVVVYQIRGRDSEDRMIPIFTLTSQDKAFEQGIIDEYLSS